MWSFKLGAIVLVFATISDASLPKLKLNSDRLFVDPDGRVVVLHGLAADSNFALLERTDAEMAMMRTWGFNVVRMGFHWHLYETQPGVFNETYMSGVYDLAKRFAGYGIYTILDMHQDNWSPLFCGGHGIPEFYGQPENTSDYIKGGPKAYPEPVARPTYGPDEYMPFGKISDCSNVSSSAFGWASSYITYALGNAAQRLYDNDQGILGRFANFWVRYVECAETGCSRLSNTPHATYSPAPAAQTPFVAMRCSFTCVMISITCR